MNLWLDLAGLCVDIYKIIERQLRNKYPYFNSALIQCRITLEKVCCLMSMRGRIHWVLSSSPDQSRRPHLARRPVVEQMFCCVIWFDWQSEVRWCNWSVQSYRLTLLLISTFQSADRERLGHWDDSLQLHHQAGSLCFLIDLRLPWCQNFYMR